jgi:translation elongation factor P/translation initiation factor 5A
MSIQLANKVNELCQKIKILNKKIDADTQIIKENQEIEYLSANLVISETLKFINVAANGVIPYNNVLENNNITLNPSGAAIINSTGLYSISFLIHSRIDFTPPGSTDTIAAVALAVNGVIKDGTNTSTLITISPTPTEIQKVTPLSNTIVLSLNEGDSVTVVNKTRFSNTDLPVEIITETIPFVPGQTSNCDANLVIHKL